jgi:hypothetical protein
MRAKAPMPKFLLNKWVLFVLMMLVLVIPFAKAQTEYTSNLWVDAGFFRDNTQMYSPQVACNPSNTDECVVMNYFGGDSFGGKVLQARYSYNGFDSVGGAFSMPQAVDYSLGGDIIEQAKKFGLSYDVYHNGSKFIFVFDQAGDSGQSYVYQWDSTNGFVQLYATGTTKAFMKIQEVNGVPLVFGLERNAVTATINLTWFYLYNGTTESVVTNIIGIPTHAVRKIDARGFVARSGSTTLYHINYTTPDAGGIWLNYSIVNLGGFTGSDYDGIWYWDGSKIFYRTTDSIRSQASSDFSSFGDISSYHVFDTAYDENITYTDYYLSGAIANHGFSKSSNQTGRTVPFDYLTGIFVAQTPLKQLRIAFPSSTDLNTGLISDANLTGILSCNEYVYDVTETVSGGVADFYTSCQNNTLTLINSGYKPAVFSFGVSLADECIPTTVTIDRQYLSPYNLNVMVRDNINNLPISGATVIIDSITNTSGADGKAVIAGFFPTTNDTFSVSKIGCNYDLNYDGTPRAISVIASKASYSVLAKTDYLATKPFGEFFEGFARDYLIRLLPPSTTLAVKVLSSDGVEVTTGSPNVELAVYGQNQSYLFLSGSYFLQSVSNNLPSTFLLVDNRTSFSVNVTLRYYGEYHQQNVTVYQNGFQTATFYLDVQSSQLSCSTADDCPSTSCNGQYFNELIGCIANRCEYSSSTCMSSALCDSSKGCFDLQGTDSCIDDTDCVDLSTCLTDYRSRVGICGSQSLCIYKDYLCSFQCNVTTGKCGETDFCLVFGQASRRFLIYSTGQYGGGITNTYVDVDFRCGLDHRGERFCIHGAQIPNVGNPKIVTIPDIWKSSSNSTTLIYNDISANCDEGCSFNYTYCSYGCNDATGLCYSAPTTAGGSAKNLVNTFSGFFILLFPTVPEQLIIYIFISVLLAAGITYYVGKNGSGNNGLVFLGITIAMSLVGIPIGVVPLFVGVIYAIVAGFLVMKMWRGI